MEKMKTEDLSIGTICGFVKECYGFKVTRIEFGKRGLVTAVAEKEDISGATQDIRVEERVSFKNDKNSFMGLTVGHSYKTFRDIRPLCDSASTLDYIKDKNEFEEINKKYEQTAEQFVTNEFLAYVVRQKMLAQNPDMV